MFHVSVGAKDLMKVNWISRDALDTWLSRKFILGFSSDRFHLEKLFSFWWKRTLVVFVLENKLYKSEHTGGVFPRKINVALLSKQS